MSKTWRVVSIMTLMLLMAFAIMGSNNGAISNPEQGTFMYTMKNVDLYLEKGFKFLMNYLKDI